MSKDIDPRQVKYGNGEYGTGPDGRIYNRQGGETWQSQYDRNVRETREIREENEAARRRYEEEQRRSREREYARPSSRSSGLTDGISGGGLLSGFFALLTGWLGLIPIVLVLMGGAIIYGIIKENSHSISSVFDLIGDFFSGLFSVLGQIFTMPFTAWPDLFADLGSFFCKLELLFGIGIILYTINELRKDHFFMDYPYLLTVLGFTLLEFLHHFSGPLGFIASLYNGLCLSLPVLLILLLISRIGDRLM